MGWDEEGGMAMGGGEVSVGVGGVDRKRDDLHGQRKTCPCGWAVGAQRRKECDRDENNKEHIVR